LQEIIVNAQTRIVESWETNKPGWGHALYLVIPETMFLAAAKGRENIQAKICEDLNKLHNVKSEYLAAVFLEMDVPEDRDWRHDSGLLVTTSRGVSPEAADKIWAEGFRVFLSHKSEVKKEAAALRDDLSIFGISAFVAHEDIRPTKPWQDEIEAALLSMDAFVALMTDGFHDSDWTDQEVGFALARGVPVIAVKLGRDPYGFIGKFQALRTDWGNAAEGIVKLLLKPDRMFSAYVQAVRNCTSFDRGNVLARVLPSIEAISEKQVDEMITAVNDNIEVRGSYGFNGKKPSFWGDGVLPHLHRLSGRRFTQDRLGKIWPEGETTPTETAADEVSFF
jgi:hypothetical protein